MLNDAWCSGIFMELSKCLEIANMILHSTKKRRARPASDKKPKRGKFGAEDPGSEGQRTKQLAGKEPVEEIGAQHAEAAEDTAKLHRDTL